MNNKTLIKELATNIHHETHKSHDVSHGFDNGDVINAAALLHALVMDVSAPYLIDKCGQDMAEALARTWGSTLRSQIEIMTGADVSDFIKGLTPVEEVKQ